MYAVIQIDFLPEFIGDPNEGMPVAFIIDWRIEDIRVAEHSRLMILEQNPKINPQNIQVISYTV